MAITLYGFGQSRSFRALWALEEVGADFNYVELKAGEAGDGGLQNPEFLKKSPQGKVPTLQHDDFVLTESAAIVNYIATLSDGDQFIPADPKLRAKYDELCFFILADLEQPLWTSGKHRFAIPEEHRVPEVLATATWEYEKSQTALLKMAQLDTYLVGDNFTFADLLLAHTIGWAERFKFPVDQLLLDYRDRQFQRPAVAAAIAHLPS